MKQIKKYDIKYIMIVLAYLILAFPLWAIPRAVSLVGWTLGTISRVLSAGSEQLLNFGEVLIRPSAHLYGFLLKKTGYFK